MAKINLINMGIIILMNIIYKENWIIQNLNLNIKERAKLLFNRLVQRVKSLKRHFTKEFNAKMKLKDQSNRIKRVIMQENFFKKA